MKSQSLASRPIPKDKSRRILSVAQEAFSIDQAADFLGVSPRFIEMEINRGRLRKSQLSRRLVRITRAELEKYLEQNAVK